MSTRLPLWLLATGSFCLVAAQLGSGPARYEVVSIKPSEEQNTNKTFRFAADGGFRAGNYSLKDLIRLGWDVRDFQISGGPTWLNTERYNVQAKPDAPFNPHSPQGQERYREMVQTMLHERFHLQVHQQQKEMSVSFLTVTARGARLKRTGDTPDLSTQMGDGKGHMWATKFDLSLLARYLSGELGYPVLDQTGLAGVYDFELTWNPDEGKPSSEMDPRPSMVKAIKEQLGLELKRGKGMVEVVVVESAEKAIGN